MLEIINVLDERWIQFVEHSSDTTVFHHPFWLDTLSKSYGYRPFVIILRGRGDELLGGLAMMEINSWLTGKRWVALPFTDHCKPLVKEEDIRELFAAEVMAKRKELNTPGIEVRYELPLVGNWVRMNSYFMHYLNLEKGSDELYRRFRKKGVQYCIKKAAKSGVVFSRSVDLTGLMTFYDLHLMTRKKLGVPTQPKRYFRKLFQDIINRGMGFVMLAYFDGRAIAGGVFLHYKKNLIYKYGASDPDYVHLYGNHGLLWEVIQWGCRNGFHVLDWGRTDEKNEGLRNFKLGWGTEEKRLSYSYIGEPPKDYSTGWKQRMVENTIRKSPVWVGRLLGAGLYKHVG